MSFQESDSVFILRQLGKGLSEELLQTPTLGGLEPSQAGTH